MGICRQKSPSSVLFGCEREREMLLPARSGNLCLDSFSFHSTCLNWLQKIVELSLAISLFLLPCPQTLILISFFSPLWISSAVRLLFTKVQLMNVFYCTGLMLLIIMSPLNKIFLLVNLVISFVIPVLSDKRKCLNQDIHNQNILSNAGLCYYVCFVIIMINKLNNLAFSKQKS